MSLRQIKCPACDKTFTHRDALVATAEWAEHWKLAHVSKMTETSDRKIVPTYLITLRLVDGKLQVSGGGISVVWDAWLAKKLEENDAIRNEVREDVANLVDEWSLAMSSDDRGIYLEDLKDLANRIRTGGTG